MQRMARLSSVAMAKLTTIVRGDAQEHEGGVAQALEKEFILHDPPIVI